MRDIPNLDHSLHAPVVPDPTAEDAYWAEHYIARPYTSPDTDYNELRPAYRYGWENATYHHGKRFADLEPELARDWRARHHGSTLPWDQARPAVRDAWDRINHH